MKRISRGLPSPALVIACLALFIALGGTVLAATKIDGRRIKARSLPGNRIEVGSLPGNRIAAGSLTGSQLQLGTLGQVPSATHADSADSARRAQTATSADHAADATTINGHAVGCLAGRRQYAGACWDLFPSVAAVDATEAAAACAAAGGELPMVLTFMRFVREPGMGLSAQGEWTNEVSVISNLHGGVVLLPSGEPYVEPLQNKFHFRCVTPLVG